MRGVAEQGDAGDVAPRFALEAFDLAHARPDPARTVDEVFALLEHGWAAACPQNPDPA